MLAFLWSIFYHGMTCLAFFQLALKRTSTYQARYRPAPCAECSCTLPDLLLLQFLYSCTVAISFSRVAEGPLRGRQAHRPEPVVQGRNVRDAERPGVAAEPADRPVSDSLTLVVMFAVAPSCCSQQRRLVTTNRTFSHTKVCRKTRKTSWSTLVPSGHSDNLSPT